MALTEAQKRDVFAGVAKRTKGLQSLNTRKPSYDKSWIRNFVESLAEQFLVEGNPGIDVFEGLLNEDPKAIGKGLAMSTLAGLRGNLGKDVVGKVKQLAKKGPLLDDLFKSGTLDDVGAEVGVFGDVLSTKVQRAKKLIEESGGKKITVEGSTISWTTPDKQKRTVDIAKERFGSRSLGTNPRATQSAPRDYSVNPRITRETDKYIGGADAEGLGANPTKAQVQKGRKGELGQVTIPAAKKAKTISSQKLPAINLPGRFRLKDKVGTKSITFASDFDKAAYNLATSKKPNQDLLAELQIQTGFDEETLVQHGIRIKNRVDQLSSSGQPLTLKPRSVQVIGEAEPEGIGKQILKTPSELKFSIDLPALRQSARPTVLHPIKSGLPALKRSLGSITEKGYRENLLDLNEKSPVYDILDTATALGESKGKQLYPNIGELQKLAGAKDLTDYFSGPGGWAEKIPLLGEGVVKPSKRMFDMYQRTIRGSEVERLAERIGVPVEELAKNVDSELGNVVRRVNDETGYGSLGPYLEGSKAGELLSNVFTAPRNVAAKAQFYNPQNYFGTKGSRYGKGPVRRDFLEDQAKWVGGTAGAMGAVEALGGESEFNPLNSQFGVNIDNWRPDIFGGEKAFITTPPRLVTEARVSSKGNEYEGSPLEDLTKFARGRLRPGLPAMAYDALNYNPDTGARENYLGEDIAAPYDEEVDPLGAAMFGERPYSRWIAEQFTPALPGDISEAMEYAGPLAAAASVPLGFLGMGSASYDPYAFNPYRPPKKFIKVRKDKGGTSKPSGRRRTVG